jgi:hypothetical protein
MKPYVLYEYNQTGDIQRSIKTKKDMSVAKYIEQTNLNLEM